MRKISHLLSETELLMLEKEEGVWNGWEGKKSFCPGNKFVPGYRMAALKLYAKEFAQKMEKKLTTRWQRQQHQRRRLLWLLWPQSWDIKKLWCQFFSHNSDVGKSFFWRKEREKWMILVCLIGARNQAGMSGAKVLSKVSTLKEK